MTPVTQEQPNHLQTKVDLQKSAQAAQAAIANLLLLENRYEMYDFPRFFASLDTLNERFRAWGESTDPRAKDASAAWNKAIADLAEALNLITQPKSAKEALEALGPQADEYVIEVAAGVKLKVTPKDFGQYWLVPKHLYAEDDQPPMFAEFVTEVDGPAMALPQHIED